MKKLSPSTQKYIFFLKSLYQSSKGYTFILALALGLTLHSLLVAYAVVIRVESISTKVPKVQRTVIMAFMGLKLDLIAERKKLGKLSLILIDLQDLVHPLWLTV